MDAAALDAGRPGAREAVLTEDPLHPMIVAYLLDLMSEAECDELEKYASASCPTPEIYCERANEWLRRRFPEIVVVELDADTMARRRRKAGTN
jgi:glutaredoxin